MIINQPKVKTVKERLHIAKLNRMGLTKRVWRHSMGAVNIEDKPCVACKECMPQEWRDSCCPCVLYAIWERYFMEVEHNNKRNVKRK